MLLRYRDLGGTMSLDEAPRERGRPARTNPGTASAISSTRVDRQRCHGSASAGPMRFPPAGRPAAASQGNRAAGEGRGCGRDARAPGGCRPDVAVEGIRRVTSLESRRAPFGKLPFSCEPCPRSPRPGGPFESETREVHGLSGVGTGFLKPVCWMREHGCTGCTG